MTAIQFIKMISNMPESKIVGDNLSNAPMKFHNFIGELSSCINKKDAKVLFNTLQYITISCKNIKDLYISFEFVKKKDHDNILKIFSKKNNDKSIIDNDIFSVKSIVENRKNVIILKPFRISKRSPISQITCIRKKGDM